MIGDHDHREDDCDDTNSSSWGFAFHCYALHLSSMKHSSSPNGVTKAGMVGKWEQELVSIAVEWE